MGLNPTKPVFRVSNKAKFKPVSSTTDTEYAGLCFRKPPKAGFLTLKPIYVKICLGFKAYLQENLSSGYQPSKTQTSLFSYND